MPGLRDRDWLPTAGRRWTAEDARPILARLDASGLTVRDFAAEHGVDAQRLYHWRGRLRGQQPAFVEVARPAATSPIEVVLGSGHVLRVPDGFGEDTLRRIVAVLDEQASGC